MQKRYGWFLVLLLLFTVGASAQSRQQADNSLVMPGSVVYAQAAGNAISLTLFPNPAREFLNVRWMNLQTAPVQLKVFNILGEELFSVSAQNSNIARLDISNLPQGVYYLRFVSNDIQDVVRFRKE